MPELRRDPVLGRWVIIATDRARRPADFQLEPPEAPPDFCPFCEGNESKTPPETLAFREEGTGPNTPGWQIRVVPNKYPVLGIEGEVGKKGHGIYDRMNGIGAHEVVIETPEHKTTFTHLDDDHVADIIRAWRMRVYDLQRDKRMVCAMIFKNVGRAAGATLDHTHTQIIVTPVVPRTVLQEMEGARKFFDYRGRCLFCDIVEQEVGEGRLVFEHGNFVAFCPYASRFPLETWIVPKQHESHFERLTPQDITEFAHVLKQTVLRIEGAIASGPYNFIVHSSPLNVGEVEHYHWHVEIIPRLTRVAGFEWGTGFYINPVPPESAAEYLRELKLPGAYSAEADTSAAKAGPAEGGSR